MIGKIYKYIKLTHWLTALHSCNKVNNPLLIAKKEEKSDKTYIRPSLFRDR